DVFFDPGDARHVLAVAHGVFDGGSMPGLFESRDGGAGFGAPLFALGGGEGTITGVEIARSAPRTIYLTVYHSTGVPPALLRSDDGGASFAAAGTWPAGDNTVLRILAVDP